MPVRNQGFASLHTVEEAIQILHERVNDHTETEQVSTAQAMHRKLATDIIAGFDQPGFKRAAMDGFAIRVEDSYGASDTNPKQLDIVGSVEIGDTSAPAIQSGQAIRISTGAPLPDNANGVIKIEDTEVFGEKVEIYSSITEGKNIAREDEDVKKGEVVLKTGTILQPWDIGILESLAQPVVTVFSKPRVATLSTGNELIGSGEIPSMGQVVDSNRPSINAWIENMGAEVVLTETCHDEKEEIATKLINLATQSDLIVTSGGTSVGTKDYLGELIEELGELWVHGIAIRPGKPVALGKIRHDSGETIIIALPGYPLAAFLNFHLFVSSLLHRWTGRRELLSERRTVRLAEKVASKVGTHDFVRLRDSAEGARLIRITGAGILSSIVRADYLLEVPTTVEGYNAGVEVEVYVLR
ncbi:MAG: molybdopterin molybdotransferase MoeA [Candidatus Kariarchaeaceae archaeon]|jgi:molybdopterin molybdotransferase